MDARSYAKLNGAVCDSLGDILWRDARGDLAGALMADAQIINKPLIIRELLRRTALWPEVLKFLEDRGIRGEICLAAPPRRSESDLRDAEGGIWIRLWPPVGPTPISSDTFWAVVPEEIAMRILVLGELP